MSITAITKKFEDLSKEYDRLFDETEDLIVIYDKKIDDALKDQLLLEMNWELLAKKLNHVYDWCETEVDSCYADAVKSAMMDKYREVTFSEAKIYAKADASYKKSLMLLNDIRHIRDECKGLVESVRSRKYVLNNLTNLVVAGMNNHII